MEQLGQLRYNAQKEDEFQVSSQCIRYCGLLGKNELAKEDRKCLFNCGYNCLFLKNETHLYLQAQQAQASED